MYDSPRLTRLQSVLASTGEMLRLGAPRGLQNATYTINITVPLIRCQPSSDYVREQIIAAAYGEVLHEYYFDFWYDIFGDPDLPMNRSYSPSINSSISKLLAKNFTFHPENLTLDYNNDSSAEVYVGLYTKWNNDALAYWSDFFWFAITNPSNGSIFTPVKPNSFNTSYYSCGLRNASVATHVSFLNNLQTLQAKDIQYFEFPGMNGNGSSRSDDVEYVMSKYRKHMEPIFKIIESSVHRHQKSGQYTNTNIENTIFGTASDFTKMETEWMRIPGGGFKNIEFTPQNKTLATLIEDFSLNKSWALMAIDELK